MKNASAKPIGYEFLRQQYRIKSIPYYRASFLGDHWQHVTILDNNKEEHYFPPSYNPGATLGDHIDFALKYEGLDLTLLAGLFELIDRQELIAIIQEKPHGQYRRKLWFLFEFLTNEKLPIADLKTGNYVALADDKLYFTKSPEKSSRHRINMNLFGTRKFCPLIRKTEKITQYQDKKLEKMAMLSIKKYPPELLARAVSYLYTKETKASFQIEREEPEHTRAENFIRMLRLAEKKSFLNKMSLIELQNEIVDPRFAARDYRDFQNYVGETHSFGKEKVHYICPQPEDVEDLMQGLLEASRQMTFGEFDPVLFAAIAAFGFVYIHPFEDGNGRIHRFLIHNILAHYRFTPPGMIFPVSAAMLQQIRKYDATLESFSNALQPLINYTLNDDGEMHVKGSTGRFYRYIDFTFIGEQLYEFIENTVIDQLPAEFNFLARYDATKRALRGVVDMPERLLDLFIKTCTTNHGKLSKSKRDSHFAKLTNEEVVKLEKAFADALENFEDERHRFSIETDD